MTRKPWTWNEWAVKAHGTRAAYQRHLAHGTRICVPCREGSAADSRRRRADNPEYRDAYNALRRERYAENRAAGMSWQQARLMSRAAA